MDDEAAERAAAKAESLRTRAQEQVDVMSMLFRQAAEALELSAELAEEHARRQERSGRTGSVENERQAANRARQAALRARSRADEWLKAGSASNR